MGIRSKWSPRGCATAALPSIRPGGGRTWWAHLEFTPINIGPTILRKKIEELHEVGASIVDGRLNIRESDSGT